MNPQTDSAVRIKWSCPICNHPLSTEKRKGGGTICCERCRFEVVVPIAISTIPFTDFHALLWECPKCGRYIDQEEKESGEMDYCPQCKIEIFFLDPPPEGVAEELTPSPPDSEIQEQEEEEEEEAEEVAAEEEGGGKEEYEDDYAPVNWRCPKCKFIFEIDECEIEFTKECPDCGAEITDSEPALISPVVRKFLTREVTEEPEGPAMIDWECSYCERRLSVEEEKQGGEICCQHCGAESDIPLLPVTETTESDGATIMDWECPKCEKELYAPESEAGQVSSCQDCGAVFIIPRPCPRIETAKAAGPTENIIWNCQNCNCPLYTKESTAGKRVSCIHCLCRITVPQVKFEKLIPKSVKTRRIDWECPKCGRSLSTKEESAGGRVCCPGCGVRGAVPIVVDPEPRWNTTGATWSCPKCPASLYAPESKAGNVSSCPECGAVFIIPLPYPKNADEAEREIDDTKYIIWQCGYCDRRLYLGKNAAGKKTCCPGCKTVTVVPKSDPGAKKWECLYCATTLNLREERDEGTGRCPDCSAVFTIAELLADKTKKNPTRKRAKQEEIIDKVVSMDRYSDVLAAICIFNWASCDQIAQYRNLGYRRTAFILSKLQEYKMVMKKQRHRNVRAYWYLIEAGKEVLRRRSYMLNPDNTAKRNEISELEQNHHMAVVDSIIKLSKKGFNCTPPRYSLWPDELRELTNDKDKKYKATPDFWIEDVGKFTIAVEVECSWRGQEGFAKRLHKRKKVFWGEDRRIFWLYIPANPLVEKHFQKVADELVSKYKYTATIKTKNRDKITVERTVGLDAYGDTAAILFADLKVEEVSIPFTGLGCSLDLDEELFLRDLNSAYEQTDPDRE